MEGEGTEDGQKSEKPCELFNSPPSRWKLDTFKRLRQCFFPEAQDLITFSLNSSHRKRKLKGTRGGGESVLSPSPREEEFCVDLHEVLGAVLDSEP